MTERGSVLEVGASHNDRDTEEEIDGEEQEKSLSGTEKSLIKREWKDTIKNV